MNELKKGEVGEKLASKIKNKAQKKIKAREEGGEIMFGFGLFGIIGWSIAIPTLAGIGIGVLLDRRFDSNISWTLTLLFVGVFIGCMNAWYWLNQYGGDE